MKKYRRVAHWVGITIGAGLLLFQVLQGIHDFQDIPFRLKSPSLLILALVALVYASYQQMEAWGLIMKSISVKIPRRGVIRGYFLTFLPRYIPGTIWGYLSRAEWLYQEYQVDYATSNLVSFIEVGISIYSSVFIYCLFLVLNLHGVILFLGLVALISSVPAVWFSLILLGKFAPKNWLFTKGFAFDQLVKLQPYELLGSIFLKVINWFFFGATSLLLAYCFGSQISIFSLPTLFNFSAYYGLAWLVGFLVVIIPSGLGMRELVLSRLLQSTQDFSLSQASAIAVSIRLIVILSELFWVISAVALKGIQYQSKQT